MIMIWCTNHVIAHIRTHTVYTHIRCLLYCIYEYLYMNSYDVSAYFVAPPSPLDSRATGAPAGCQANYYVAQSYVCFITTLCVYTIVLYNLYELCHS